VRRGWLSGMPAVASCRARPVNSELHAIERLTSADFIALLRVISRCHHAMIFVTSNPWQQPMR
jgi:hypothetical protein